jgi:hypothetical protein
MEAKMSDPRLGDYQDPNDPMRRAGTPYEGRRSNAALGWIAGAVFLVVVLALIFGLGGDGDRTAGTGTTPPAATTGQAPSGGTNTVPRTTTGQGNQTTPAPSAPPSGSAK